MMYFVRVVLTKFIEASNPDEAWDLAEYHAGDMTEHEVEIELIDPDGGEHE